jgi:hypothetical protein
MPALIAASPFSVGMMIFVFEMASDLSSIRFSKAIVGKQHTGLRRILVCLQGVAIGA